MATNNSEFFQTGETVQIRLAFTFRRKESNSTFMSDEPVEIDLKFLPDWLKEGPAENRYAGHAGEAEDRPRRADREERDRPPRGERGPRREGPSRNRDDRRGPRREGPPRGKREERGGGA